MALALALTPMTGHASNLVWTACFNYGDPLSKCTKWRASTAQMCEEYKVVYARDVRMDSGWVLDGIGSSTPDGDHCVLDTAVHNTNTGESYAHSWVNSGHFIAAELRESYKVCMECLRYGNPIYPLTGSKRNEIDLGSWLSTPVKAIYDTRRKVPFDDPGNVLSVKAPASFGELWTSSLHKQLLIQPKLVVAARGSALWTPFTLNAAGTYAPDGDVADQLVSASGGWRYYDVSAQAVETYDSNGFLQQIAYASGKTLTFTYSTSATPATVAPVPGLLIQVDDNLGRRVQFQYEQPATAGLDPHIIRATDVSGANTDFAYDALGNLSKITWPDGKTQQYLYETGLSWALTGVVDENGKRTTTYGYDDKGRAIETQAAGGVDHYKASYTVPPQWEVTESYDPNESVLWRSYKAGMPQGTSITLANGQTAALTTTVVQGTPRVSSISQPAGAGCSASASATAYDANGNVTSADDFNGIRSCYAYDLARNVRTTAVEGLANTVACSSVTAANATLPAGGRKVSTSWHPQWRIEARRAEPGRLTTMVYNGEPDPFNGGAAATCAPASATLPDGKRIAVLCKKVEQATLDTNGTKAFDVQGAAATTGDPDFAKVSLLLHMDSLTGTSLTDSSSLANPVSTYGNVGIAGGGKFSSSSLVFDGSIGSYAVAPASVLQVGSSDFTIETWVRLNSYRGNGTLISNYGGGGARGLELLTQSDGTVLFRYSLDGVGDAGSAGFATPLALNTWTHIAAVRKGSALTVYVNGTPGPTATLNGTISSSSTLTNLGRTPDVGSGVWYVDGSMDEVRVTKGLARYTGAFAVPTAPFGNTTTSTPAIPSSMDTSVANRVWSYTYNQYGQVLTAKGPRTDVNDTTTYEYYTDTTVDHTVGDLKTVTNAKGQATQFTQYNKAGQVLRSVDANSVTTDYTYDARQRLKSVSVAGQMASYDYLPSGQLKRVTQADASYVEYSYDDAQRLVAMNDNLGNRIDYTLDNAGRRTAETVKDPSGALSRQVSRVMDALGRVQQVTGRE